ncbi:MAG: SH3 domain-containing protein [Chloroflexota bacterium]|nr:MAG: hypothetical protein DIU68_10885 [Chloroflexota bacterium]
MKRWAQFLTVLAAFLLLTPVVQAQDAPPQINDALADLSTRLGRVVTLETIDAWRYVVDRYTDTALGCPLVTPQPVPEGIIGYRFELVVDGITYDYRVSTDRTILFPCDANLLQTPPDAATTPVIPDTPDVALTPETGEACPPNFEGLLPPRLAPNTSAEVIGAAPSRLRNSPSLAGTQIDLINPGVVVDVTGGPICADEYVWWQVIAEGRSGWMAEGALPDAYFLAPMTETPTVAPALTPETTTPPEPGEVVIIESGDLPELAAALNNRTLTTFDIGPDFSLAERTVVDTIAVEFGPALLDLQWSPDGRYLAYVVREGDDAYSLYLTDIAGSEPIALANDVYFPLKVTFSLDSTEVLYPVASSDTMQVSEEGITINVYSQSVTGESGRSLRGSFTFGGGCGGGSSFPGDHVYWWDAGSNGRPLVFENTPAGIVHSTNCTGSGTALLDLETGESIEIGSDLSRVDVSPDGRQLVGVRVDDMATNAGVIMLVDLATLELMPLGAVAQPDQVAWASPTIIYYSVRTPTGDIVPGSDSQIVSNAGMIEGVPVYEAALHRIDLEATTDAEIWRGSGYGISRLYAAPDGSGLYFNLVPNGDAWVEALNAGTITFSSPQSEQEAFFYPTLYRLVLETGDVEVIAEGLLNPAFNDAAFMDSELTAG